MITPAYITVIDDERMGISRTNSPGSKEIRETKDRIEELLNMESYEDLNKELISNYRFLFQNKD